MTNETFASIWVHLRAVIAVSVFATCMGCAQPKQEWALVKPYLRSHAVIDEPTAQEEYFLELMRKGALDLREAADLRRLMVTIPWTTLSGWPGLRQEIYDATGPLQERDKPYVILCRVAVERDYGVLTGLDQPLDARVRAYIWDRSQREVLADIEAKQLTIQGLVFLAFVTDVEPAGKLFSVHGLSTNPGDGIARSGAYGWHFPSEVPMEVFYPEDHVTSVHCVLDNLLMLKKPLVWEGEVFP